MSRKKRWANILYKRVGWESDPCTYCGSPSEHWDHIPPLHLTTRLLQLELIPYDALQKVRACKTCNLILAGNVLTTILERKKYLFNYYSAKGDLRALRVLSLNERIKLPRIRSLKRKCICCNSSFTVSHPESNQIYCSIEHRKFHRKLLLNSRFIIWRCQNKAYHAP
jgi:hypothetical protein